MGWNVEVEFKRSGLHGTGAFAREAIAAGTKVWQFDAAMRVCTPDELAALDPETLSFALWGGYLHKPSGLFLWYTDGMQFLNHGSGDRANVGLDFWPKLEEDHIVALRNVAPGEELREDYGFCLDGGLAPEHWMRPLYLDFCPQHYFFLLGLQGEKTPETVGAQFGRKRRTMAINASSSTGLDNTASKPEAKHAA